MIPPLFPRPDAEPPQDHDAADAHDPHDRRGSDGAPAYGRRRVDAVSAALDFKKLAALVALGCSVIGFILSGVLWLGSTFVGPGENIAALRRQQLVADSIATEERADMRALIRGTNVAIAATNANVARLAYDVCVEVKKRTVGACFEAFNAQISTATPPSDGASIGPR